MSAVRSLSNNDSSSGDTDDEMPKLMAVSWVADELSRDPHIQRPSTWPEVAALGNETIEGLFMAAHTKPHLVRLLNGYLRDTHGVCLSGISADKDGVLSVVFKQTYPHARRRCRWDRQFWSLRETLEWALTERHATLQWTLEFWERDFER